MNMSEIKARILSTKKAYVSLLKAEGFNRGYEWAAKQASYAELQRLLDIEWVESMTDVFQFVMGDDPESPNSAGWIDKDDDKGRPFAEGFVEGATRLYREAMAA